MPNKINNYSQIFKIQLSEIIKQKLEKNIILFYLECYPIAKGVRVGDDFIFLLEELEQNVEMLDFVYLIQSAGNKEKNVSAKMFVGIKTVTGFSKHFKMKIENIFATFKLFGLNIKVVEVDNLIVVNNLLTDLFAFHYDLSKHKYIAYSIDQPHEILVRFSEIIRITSFLVERKSKFSEIKSLLVGSTPINLIVNLFNLFLLIKDMRVEKNVVMKKSDTDSMWTRVDDIYFFRNNVSSIIKVLKKEMPFQLSLPDLDNLIYDNIELTLLKIEKVPGLLLNNLPEGFSSPCITNDIKKITQYE